MLHSTQMYIPLKPPFSRHKGVGVQFTDEPTGALDSASGAQVMELFRQLHENGATIIMITHDAQVARQAQRIMTIRDGVLSGGDSHE